MAKKAKSNGNSNGKSQNDDGLDAVSWGDIVDMFNADDDTVYDGDIFFGDNSDVGLMKEVLGKNVDAFVAALGKAGFEADELRVETDSATLIVYPKLRDCVGA